MVSLILLGIMFVVGTALCYKDRKVPYDPQYDEGF